jgi:hypothetical protein
MTANTQRARELLAAEFDAAGLLGARDRVADDQPLTPVEKCTIRAIEAALSQSQQAVTFTNDGSSEAQFIADADRLNCPACGGSGHVDDAQQTVAVPDGFVLVPTEPTLAMVNAALIARDDRIKARAAANGGTFLIGGAPAAGSLVGTYRAMLAAATPAPSGGWRSIAEVPPHNPRKDSLGTEYLIWPATDGGDRTAFFGRRLGGMPCWYRYGAPVHGVTHWQPLPPAPKPAEGG